MSRFAQLVNAAETKKQQDRQQSAIVDAHFNLNADAQTTTNVDAHLSTETGVHTKSAQTPTKAQSGRPQTKKVGATAVFVDAKASTKTNFTNFVGANASTKKSGGRPQ